MIVRIAHRDGWITSPYEAVAALVRDGDSVALEGFTHPIPFAAGYEILRQDCRELELIRMTPDVLYDQMVGLGAARKLVFSYAGNPGVGSTSWSPCRRCSTTGSGRVASRSPSLAQQLALVDQIATTPAPTSGEVTALRTLLSHA
jgi:hypothetical protein